MSMYLSSFVNSYVFITVIFPLKNMKSDFWGIKTRKQQSVLAVYTVAYYK